jgi:hypothetical protein
VKAADHGTLLRGTPPHVDILPGSALSHLLAAYGGGQAARAARAPRAVRDAR